MAEIDSSILILKDKVKGQKRKTHVIHALLIILGALITLVLGLKIPELEVWQKNIALTLGALLTIVSSWNAVFDYKKL
ncbi:TPA: SLATT domain-containing protein, partial [Vibrio cholerae]|nr:SLATT domain-containing protein [Vibrio cholerae]